MSKGKRLSLFQKELRSAFAQKKASNPSFSERAFARQLKIPYTTLKYILDGQRQPSQNSFKKISAILQWNGAKVARVMESLRTEDEATRQERMSLWVEHDKNSELLADPLTLALRTLATAPNTKADIAFLADKLGVTEARVRDSLALLSEHRMVEITDKLRVTGPAPYFKETPDSLAAQFKKSILTHIEKARQDGEIDENSELLFHQCLRPDQKEKFFKRLNSSRRRIQKEYPPQEGAELFYVSITVAPFKSKKGSSPKPNRKNSP